jgi:hypothetical protein
VGVVGGVVVVVVAASRAPSQQVDGVVAVTHTEGGGPRDGPRPHNHEQVCIHCLSVSLFLYAPPSHQLFVHACVCDSVCVCRCSAYSCDCV